MTARRRELACCYAHHNGILYSYLLVLLSYCLLGSLTLWDISAGQLLTGGGVSATGWNPNVTQSLAKQNTTTRSPAYNLYGQPGQGYYIEVQIGTPPQKLNVLIDTGSSNFAIACKDHPDISTFFHASNSSTYEDLGRKVNVPYTQGQWSGQLGRDFVSITSLPGVRVKVNIACILETDNFYINGSHWQGILGLAYAGIARPDDSVEPFFDSLTNSGKVKNLFTVSLCGSANLSGHHNQEMGGWLELGQGDSRGDLYSTPLHNEWYYEVIITDISVNGTSLSMDCKEYNFGKTIVDSGTTNLRLPKKVFQLLVARIQKELKVEGLEIVPGPKFWNGEEILCWREGTAPYSSFPTVSLTLPVNNTAAFRLPLFPQQYLRAVGDENDKPGKDCFKFAIADSDSGSVLGAIMMEGFDIVFNRANKTIQFAESRCPLTTSGTNNPTIQWDRTYTGNYIDCAYVKIQSQNEVLNIVAYVMAGICGICLLPLVVLVLNSRCKRCRHRGSSKQRSRSSSDSKELVDDSS